MFLINAVFNKEHLKNILEELINNNLPGITILAAFPKGVFGIKENEHSSSDINEKIKIEIVAKEKDKQKIINIIQTECHDLGYGAGKIWVTKVEEVIRIRTGETNHDALTINKNKYPHNKNINNCNCMTHIDTPNS